MVQFRQNSQAQWFTVNASYSIEQDIYGVDSLSISTNDVSDDVRNIMTGVSEVQLSDQSSYVINQATFDSRNGETTAKFDCVGSFQWEFKKKNPIKKAPFPSTSVTNGKETRLFYPFKKYLDALFANSSFTYRLNTQVADQSFDDFGNNDRMSLFTRMLDDVGLAYSISTAYGNKVVTIGTVPDLGLKQVLRSNFNMTDISQSTTGTDLITRLTGYGAKKNPNDENSDVFTYSYDSPMISQFGILEAAPIEDSSLNLEQLKVKVQATVDRSISVSISIKVDPTSVDEFEIVPGARVYAINDDLNFAKELPIVKTSKTFDELGNATDISIDAGGRSKVDANRAKVSKAINNATKLNLPKINDDLSNLNSKVDSMPTGGGSGGTPDLTGYATEVWVDQRIADTLGVVNNMIRSVGNTDNSMMSSGDESNIV